MVHASFKARNRIVVRHRLHNFAPDPPAAQRTVGSELVILSHTITMVAQHLVHHSRERESVCVCGASVCTLINILI